MSNNILSSIPDASLNYIFSFANLPMLSNLVSTCKRFRTLLYSSDQKLWITLAKRIGNEVYFPTPREIASSAILKERTIWKQNQWAVEISPGQDLPNHTVNFSLPFKIFPDGRIIITLTNQNRSFLFDVGTRRSVPIPHPHAERDMSDANIPKGEWNSLNNVGQGAIVDQDNHIQLYDSKTGKKLFEKFDTLPHVGGAKRTLLCSEATVLFGAGSIIQEWDIKTGEALPNLELSPKVKLVKLLYSDSSKIIFVALRNSFTCVCYFDRQTKKTIAPVLLRDIGEDYNVDCDQERLAYFRDGMLTVFNHTRHDWPKIKLEAPFKPTSDGIVTLYGNFVGAIVGINNGGPDDDRIGLVWNLTMRSSTYVPMPFYKMYNNIDIRFRPCCHPLPFRFIDSSQFELPIYVSNSEFSFAQLQVHKYTSNQFQSSKDKDEKKKPSTEYSK